MEAAAGMPYSELSSIYQVRGTLQSELLLDKTVADGGPVPGLVLTHMPPFPIAQGGQPPLAAGPPEDPMLDPFGNEEAGFGVVIVGPPWPRATELKRARMPASASTRCTFIAIILPV